MTPVLGGEPAVFGWVQIAALAGFLASVVSRAIIVRAHRRLNPIRLRLRKRGWLGIAEIALFVQVNIWILAIVVYGMGLGAFPGPFIFGPRVVGSALARAAGVGLIAGAFAIFVPALIALGDSWRLGVDEDQPGGLVTSGIYGLSRNPVYVFFDLWFIGTFLLNGVLLFLILALLGIANLHYQILEEERSLARVHGRLYSAYYAQTPRYFSLATSIRALETIWRRSFTPDKRQPGTCASAPGALRPSGGDVEGEGRSR